ncbi:MAG TPA: flagellar assembly protein FliX [Acetobacteraceae bacterium]
MTGIERIGWPATPRVPSRAASRSGFSVPLQPGAAGATAAATEASAPTFVSILTLQELGGETVQDREARRHGQDMLAALADLQRALLLPADDAAVLARLADLVASVPRATDRRLAAMLSAIVVRVRVELARRQT